MNRFIVTMLAVFFSAGLTAGSITATEYHWR